MARFALVFALSLAVSAPAWACGMVYSGSGLFGAFEAVDAEPEPPKPKINWVEEVGEVKYSSVPRQLRGLRGEVIGAGPLRPGPAVAARPTRTDAVPVRPARTARMAAAELPATATVEPFAVDRVRAFLSAFASEPEPASAADTADTATTADTGEP